jgi:RND family efflux transporter MFP subunit
MIGGCEAATVVLGTSEHAPAATCEHWPARMQPTPQLSATLQAALERGQLSLQEPRDETDSWDAVTHLALPLTRGGVVCGAVGVSVRGAMRGESKAIAERLSVGVALLTELLDSHDEFERVGEMLGIATTLLDHERLAPASHELAAALARHLGCERVAIGMHSSSFIGRRIRIVALSNSVRFSAQSDGLRDLRAAMQEALDQDAMIFVPSPKDSTAVVTESHQALLRGSGAGTVCTLPLSARGHPIGAVTLEWATGSAVGQSVRTRIGELGLLGGPILELLARAEAGPLERGRAWLTRWSDRHFGSERLAKVAIGIVATLVAVVALAPAEYHVSARATLEGRVQRALVAAVPGYLSEAHARAGDLVREGQVLARLDDRDLLLEMRRWKSQRDQLEREYRGALALQDRTQVSILRAQIDQAAAQLGLAEEALGRTEVVSPFDGIVLEGDLDRSLGSPVEKGSVLFEIAPLDGYRVIVEVDGRDIADVVVGQQGRLTLSALPDELMSFVVERITPISTARDGRNYFRVEAALEDPIAALRPGMEGVAKVNAGRRRLLWIWTHELLDWLRLALWSFLP